MNELNNDPDIKGIVVQKPFGSPEWKPQIRPEKDVEGSTSTKIFTPAIFAALQSVYRIDTEWNGNTVALIGRGNLFNTHLLNYLRMVGCRPVFYETTAEAADLSTDRCVQRILFLDKQEDYLDKDGILAGFEYPTDRGKASELVKQVIRIEVERTATI